MTKTMCSLLAALALALGGLSIGCEEETTITTPPPPADTRGDLERAGEKADDAIDGARRETGEALEDAGRDLQN